MMDKIVQKNGHKAVFLCSNSLPYIFCACDLRRYCKVCSPYLIACLAKVNTMQLTIILRVISPAFGYRHVVFKITSPVTWYFHTTCVATYKHQLLLYCWPLYKNFHNISPLPGYYSTNYKSYTGKGRAIFFGHPFVLLYLQLRLFIHTTC